LIDRRYLASPVIAAKAEISRFEPARPKRKDASVRWHDGWRVAAVLIPVMLAACSSASEQPGAVTADEAHQLNEAAAMLDANSVDLNAVASADTQTLSNQSDQ
jgi:hypothetical protein